MLTAGSVFSGLDAFGLGFHRAGFDIRWHAEKHPYRRAVLAARFPGSQIFDDVEAVTPATAEQVDLIFGGFPCKDVSRAGRKGGLAGPESRLWWQMLRCVRDMAPEYVFVENVSDLAVRGLGDVLGSLAESGYDAEWDCLPAAAFGAPHLRDRLWLVAYPDDSGRVEQRRAVAVRAQQLAAERADADADGDGRARDGGAGLRAGGPGRQRRRRLVDLPRTEAAAAAPGQLAAALPGWRRPNPGVEAHFGAVTGPLERPPEPLLHGVDAGPPYRVDRVAACGDSGLPQIAEAIGRRIVEAARRRR